MNGSAQASVLSIKHVTKSFDGKTAVKDISLDVRKGEIFGFLGPNGAGKSTTIRLVLDILRADSGKITILGEDSRKVRATHPSIGYLSGDMVLDSDLTGRQYLSFINHAYGNHFADNIEKLSTALQAKLEVKIANYSRGNRQKIGLIAALMHEPKLLILDEPTSGFDPLVQEVFAQLMRQFSQDGGTVFMSSHVLTEVQSLCDRAAFIKDGAIVDIKTIKELTTAARRIKVAANANEINHMKRTYTQVAGLKFVRDNPGTIEFYYSGNPLPLLRYFAAQDISDFTMQEPDLEEIFNRYYEQETVHGKTV